MSVRASKFQPTGRTHLAARVTRKRPRCDAECHRVLEAVAQHVPQSLRRVQRCAYQAEIRRISIARVIGEFVISEDIDGNAFVEYRNPCELGGFDVSNLIAVADLGVRDHEARSRRSAQPQGLLADRCRRGSGRQSGRPDPHR